jgi:hypothetical protein
LFLEFFHNVMKSTPKSPKGICFLGDCSLWDEIYMKQSEIAAFTRIIAKKG